MHRFNVCLVVVWSLSCSGVKIPLDRRIIIAGRASVRMNRIDRIVRIELGINYSLFCITGSRSADRHQQKPD